MEITHVFIFSPYVVNKEDKFTNIFTGNDIQKLIIIPYHLINRNVILHGIIYRSHYGTNSSRRIEFADKSGYDGVGYYENCFNYK